MIDNLVSVWARPVYSTKNLLNGTEAGRLGKVSSKWVDLWAYGLAHLLDTIVSIQDKGSFNK